MTETPSARRRVLRPAAIGLAAAAMLAASGLAPALAATGPSMTVNHNSVNIAVQGPSNRLKFYWAVNGTTTWHPETVAGGQQHLLGAVDDRRRQHREHRRHGSRATG